MGYIAVGELVADMTPEQKIMVQQFYSKFDIGGGIANKKIVNVEPLFFDNLIAGSEFETYAATKMYIALSLYINDSFGATTTTAQIFFYDFTNTVNMSSFNAAPVWDTTAALMKYIQLLTSYNNIYFARFTVTLYRYMRFIGYRITLV